MEVLLEDFKQCIWNEQRGEMRFLSTKTEGVFNDLRQVGLDLITLLFNVILGKSLNRFEPDYPITSS